MLVALTAAQFIALPFMNLFTVLKIQKEYRNWSIIRVLIIACSTTYISLNYNINETIVVYSLAHIAMYIVAIYLILKNSKA